MKRYLIVFIMIVSARTYALDSVKLKGAWKLSNESCSSGATRKIGSNWESYKDDVVVSFKDTSITIDSEATFKMRADVGGQWISEMEDWANFSRARNEPADEPTKWIAAARQYLAGVTCTMHEEQAYRVNGSTIEFGPMLNARINCPGTTPLTDPDPSLSIIELTDDVLRVVVTTPEFGIDGHCPKDDHEVRTYVRQK